MRGIHETLFRLLGLYIRVNIYIYVYNLRGIKMLTTTPTGRAKVATHEITYYSWFLLFSLVSIRANPRGKKITLNKPNSRQTHAEIYTYFTRLACFCNNIEKCLIPRPSRILGGNTSIELRGNRIHIEIVLVTWVGCVLYVYSRETISVREWFSRARCIGREREREESAERRAEETNRRRRWNPLNQYSAIAPTPRGLIPSRALPPLLLTTPWVAASSSRTTTDTQGSPANDEESEPRPVSTPLVYAHPACCHSSSLSPSLWDPPFTPFNPTDPRTAP